MDDLPCNFSGPEPADRLAIEREARPVALCVDGEMVWTEEDKESPAAALAAYFARLVPYPEPAKQPSPNAKPALSGLSKTATGAHRGPGWCIEE